MSSGSLSKFSININEKVKNKNVDGAVGRSNELYRMKQILLRKQKSNPILIGKAGVGKTAIVEQFVKELVQNKSSNDFNDMVVYELSLTSLIAGSHERGQCEQRVMEILDEAKQNENVLLFIDEIHNLVQSDTSKTKQISIADLLKPALSRGHLKCIGATTLEEYNHIFQRDKALDRRFMPVYINEPDIIQTREILESVKYYYQDYHKCFYDSQALDMCVELSDKYYTYRNFPDKAIDIMDEVGSSKALKNVNNIQQSHVISKKDVNEFVSFSLNIPINDLYSNSFQKIKNLEYTLNSQIIGQEHAVTEVCKSLMRKETGLCDKKKPVCSFFFYGNPSVGKSCVSKILGEHYYKNIIKLDMSEYMESHSVSKLIGSPSGYVGYDEGGLLTNAVKANSYSVILFDEIEKAHPKVYDVLLQLLDYGNLTDSKGTKHSFNNCIIIMTSNIVENRKNIGFYSEDNRYIEVNHEHLKQVFRPEFLNRIDSIIRFNDLTKQNLKTICEICVNDAITKLHHLFGVVIDDVTKKQYIENIAGITLSPREIHHNINKYVIDKYVDDFLKT